MSNYTQTTNFATKDALASGNPLKVVKGTEINVEFANIATAVATKLDASGGTVAGATIATSTINSSTIGATTPSTGAFTTLSATGVTTLSNAVLPVIDNIKLGYATTATAAGTTTLTSASNNQQFFTGSTTQTVVLPVTSTLALGLSYLIVNNSTGVVTVQSSGANIITLIPAGASVRCTCILITGTTAASWSFAFEGSSNIPDKQVQSISASVAANAMTISATALALDFRNTTLGNGTVTTVSGTPANLVISSGSTLGTVNATQSRIVVIALNNAGTIELAAVNISGGFILDESTLISTTAEGGLGAADSATVIYSTTARTSVAYRVIGYIDSTQATAGTWATAPSTIQGNGGQASISLAMNASGVAPMFASRAWVNFNGQGTVAIQANGNVSSITDNGVGDYTVNFTTAMSDANYNIQSTCREFSGLAQWISVSFGTAPTTSSCRFRSCDANGTVQDPLVAYVAVFR
jgi:hypothetical protein